MVGVAGGVGGGVGGVWGGGGVASELWVGDSRRTWTGIDFRQCRESMGSVGRSGCTQRRGT